MRVGVVGAGAAGLSAALELKDAGFRDVTVFERARRVGGKCERLDYCGHTYELGAGAATTGYRRVRELMRRYHVPPLLRLTDPMQASPSDGRVRRMGWLPYNPLELVRLGVDALRYARGEMGVHRRGKLRLDTAHEDTFVPFQQWAYERGYTALLEAVRPWATAFGYGHMDEIPAAYMLNYIAMAGPLFEIRGGYQRLWEKVARGLDVRTSTTIESVERGQNGVYLQTDAGEHELDALIIACPPEDALPWLDANDTERELFGKIQYVDYNVVALDTEGLPKSSFVFVPEHLSRDAEGKPMFYYRRYPRRGVITLYSFDRGGVDNSEREAVRFVEQLGGGVKEVLTRRSWRYFPHVDTATMAERFYPRLESLQGKRRTFWVGEIFSFSTVEATVRYAQDLVTRYFARAESAGRAPHVPRAEAANDAEPAAAPKVA